MVSMLVAFGTRPEAIKVAPLIRALLKRTQAITLKVVVTAEHRQPLDQVLRLFEIEADYDLDLGSRAKNRSEFLSLAITHLSEIMSREAPDLVLVLGDTSTTLAATIAAYYQQIPLAQVEAGLRASGKFSTFPEEGHRLMTTSVTDLHFAPTMNSKEHLLNEGIDPSQIFVTGNTGIDALHFVRNRIETMRRDGSLKLPELFSPNSSDKIPARVLRAIREVETNEKRLVLITGSRLENFSRSLQSICGALARLADMYPDVCFIYPIDLPAEMRETITQLLQDHENVYLLPPLDYAAFVYLMTLSTIVLTDSGSIQEEAPGLGKPTLVMRESTDRPEALEAGAVQLVGTDAVKIVTATRRLLDDEVRYRRMSEASNVYGDGLASERIVDVLELYAYGTLETAATKSAS